MREGKGRVESRNMYKGPKDEDNGGGGRLNVEVQGGWSRGE